jgi:hypothetical protein
MFATRFAIAPALFALFLADSASAQLRPIGPPPAKAPAKEMKYFRVTLNNNSDVTVIFKMEWDTLAPAMVTLDPGKTFVAEMKRLPAPGKPSLTVTYTPAPLAMPVVKVLESGHIDPRTNNPGWIYDFVNIDTTTGPIVDLRKD